MSIPPPEIRDAWVAAYQSRDAERMAAANTAWAAWRQREQATNEATRTRLTADRDARKRELLAMVERRREQAASALPSPLAVHVTTNGADPWDAQFMLEQMEGDVDKALDMLRRSTHPEILAARVRTTA